MRFEKIASAHPKYPDAVLTALSEIEKVGIGSGEGVFVLGVLHRLYQAGAQSVSGSDEFFRSGGI